MHELPANESVGDQSTVSIKQVLRVQVTSDKVCELQI